MKIFVIMNAKQRDFWTGKYWVEEFSKAYLYKSYESANKAISKMPCSYDRDNSSIEGNETLF